MKAVVSRDVIVDCCNLCSAKCTQQGYCPCDEFRESHENDERIAQCGDVYFIKGRGIEYIGY